MRLGTAPSWRIAVEQWSAPHDCALWFRAAERIPVPAGGLVPGPLDIDPLPAPSGGGGELAADWWRWWDRLVEEPAALPTGDRPPPWVFAPPDFTELAGWPALHRVVTARWREADEWHAQRKIAGVRAMREHGGPAPQEGPLVKEVEGALGRPAAPFDLTLIILPVLDGEVREVSPTRYLVPESLYAGPEWAERLRPIVTRLATGG